jgi:gamma-glutamylcyclotransferase (GGCT)/AIG2-like uncharacterized protein YtfP
LGPTFVFAYGSNLDTTRMVGRAPSARVIGAAGLEGFELRFHKRGWRDGTGKANAFRSEVVGAVVHGVVYEVDEAELADLDVHETGYRRALIAFDVGTEVGAETVEAWVYLALPEVIDDALLPTRLYLDHVLAGARAHGLPVETIAWLESVATAG